MPFSGASGTANTIAALHPVENEPRLIQIHGRMAVKGVPGGTLVYPRVPALKPASVVNPCLPADDISTSVTPARFGMVEYVARVPVCMADQDIFQHPNDITDFNITLAEVQNWYGFYARMDVLTGNSSLGGLPDLVAPSRTLNLGGGPLTFACLEEAHDLVTAIQGKPTVIMSNARSLRSYRNLCWNAGIKPPEVQWRWYCPATRMWHDGWVPAFRGVPWVINQEMNPGLLPADRRIYFMVLGDDDGKGPTRGLTRLVPAGMEYNPFVLRMTNGVPDFATQRVNMTKDIWLTMPAGLALGSQGALSMLTNFEHVGECAGGPR